MYTLVWYFDGVRKELKSETFAGHLVNVLTEEFRDEDTGNPAISVRVVGIDQEDGEVTVEIRPTEHWSRIGFEDYMMGLTWADVVREGEVNGESFGEDEKGPVVELYVSPPQAEVVKAST